MSAPRAASVLAWALALHLAVVGVAAAFGDLWPPRPGDLLWRVAFQSQFLAATGQFLVAVAVLVAFAVWTRSRSAALGALVVGVIVAVFVAAALAAVALDYVQVRPTIRPDMRTRSDLGVVVPATVGMVAATVLIILSSAARRLRGA